MVDIDTNTIVVITGVAGSLMAILAMVYTLPSKLLDSNGSATYVDDIGVGEDIDSSTLSLKYGGKKKRTHKK